MLKKLFLWIDKIFRKFLKNFVEKTFTYSEYQTTYGIKTIKIENGIDASSIKNSAF
jgi:hypothetical protein